MYHKGEGVPQNDKTAVKFEDLVERGEVYYKKFTDIPFSGTVTGTPQGKLKNGIKDGPWVYFHENGQLLHKSTYKNGKKEGPWVKCYENGQLWKKGTYKDGKEEGPWVSYSEDGTVDNELTGTYKDGEKVK